MTEERDGRSHIFRGRIPFDASTLECDVSMDETSTLPITLVDSSRTLHRAETWGVQHA